MQIPQALPQLLLLTLRKQNQLLIIFWADFPYVGEQHQGKREWTLNSNFDLPLTSCDILTSSMNFNFLPYLLNGEIIHFVGFVGRLKGEKAHQVHSTC